MSQPVPWPKVRAALARSDPGVASGPRAEAGSDHGRDADRVDAGLNRVCRRIPPDPTCFDPRATLQSASAAVASYRRRHRSQTPPTARVSRISVAGYGQSGRRRRCSGDGAGAAVGDDAGCVLAHRGVSCAALWGVGAEILSGVRQPGIAAHWPPSQRDHVGAVGGVSEKILQPTGRRESGRSGSSPIGRKGRYADAATVLGSVQGSMPLRVGRPADGNIDAA